MPIISPEQFKTAFLNVAVLNESKLVECWSRKKPYTAAFYALLAPIALELGINVHAANYYTLDAVFYETKDTKNFSAKATYVDFISVALEHENNPRGSVTEINKLQLFNTPLKVLITYCGDDTTGRKSFYLDTYARMIQRADIFGDISTRCKQLVIFGSCESGKPAWSFHIYSNAQFTRI